MSDPSPDQQGLGARGTLALAGLVLIGTGVWFAAGWIDVSTPATDATCGWLFRTDIWLAERNPSTCRTVMPIRAGIAAVLLGGGCVLEYFAIRGRPRQRSTAARVLAAVIAVAAIVITINEVVRSDGAWRSRYASGGVTVAAEMSTAT